MRKIEVTLRDRRDGTVVVKTLTADYNWDAVDGSRFWWAEHGMSCDINRSKLMYDDALKHLQSSRDRPIIVVDFLSVDDELVYQDSDAWRHSAPGDMEWAQLVGAEDNLSTLQLALQDSSVDSAMALQRARLAVTTLAAHPRAEQFLPLAQVIVDAYVALQEPDVDFDEQLSKLDDGCEAFLEAMEG